MISIRHRGANARGDCVVIPARNEAEGVGAMRRIPAAAGLSGGCASVVLVDDESTDGTAMVARPAAAACGAADRLTIVAGTPLPHGWTGKLWAMRQGIAAATAGPAARFSAAHRCRHRLRAAGAGLAGRPRQREQAGAGVVHGRVALRQPRRARSHSGLHFFLPDVVSVRLGESAGRRDGGGRGGMHAGAG